MTTAYLLAMLMFYSAETGRPSYTLLSYNWLSQHNLCQSWRQHQVQYGDLNLDGKTDMKDFAILSTCYVPSVVVPAAEPNDTAFGHICYTVGGKFHLYSDCRYLVNKEWMPCLCESGNVCLSCLHGRLKDE